MVIDDVRRLVGDALQLGPRQQELAASSRLLGSIPELDSMAVVRILTDLEEYFGIAIADDEIAASTFDTLGSLSAFVEHKLAT